MPTACISAVRIVTEYIKPPRSLWTSFELGVPLGSPTDAAFQKRVLVALLKLFEIPKPEGPESWILVDYPEDTPKEEEGTFMQVSCPVYYGDENEKEGTDPLETAFLREIKSLRTWYDTGVAKRKRTTVGVSHIDLDDIGDFLYTFAKGKLPENPRQDVSISTELKAAVEDLRAYYFESARSQPGQENASNESLLTWFWEDAVAGKVLQEIKKACVESTDESMKVVAQNYIVPHSIADKLAKKK